MRRLLIIGCGDVALRAAPHLRDRYRIYALTHSRERAPLLRRHGIVPTAVDLDDAASLDGLAGIAHDVLRCAPPPNRGTLDTRTSHLIAALAKCESLPQQLVYISNESRRLSNRRIKQELRLKLRFPTVQDGIAAPGMGRR